MAFCMDLCKHIIEERVKNKGITLKLHHHKNKVCVKQPELGEVL